MVELLKWLSDLADHNFLGTLTIVFVMAYVGMTITTPYTLN